MTLDPELIHNYLVLYYPPCSKSSPARRSLVLLLLLSHSQFFPRGELFWGQIFIQQCFFFIQGGEGEVPSLLNSKTVWNEDLTTNQLSICQKITMTPIGAF